jgi:16S rRNA (cytosine967-C5)-methyltransferase
MAGRAPSERPRIAPARHEAFRVLVGVSRHQHDAAAALAVSRARLQDPRDAALTSELVLGVLRWQNALDAALQPLVSRDVQRLDLEVLTALRLGAYQRLFLSRVPASAAVNDAVSLVRDARHASAAGLVNAVLRRLDPERARADWPARPHPDQLEALRARQRSDVALLAAREQALTYLTITCSHPRWLAERWLSRHGFEAAEHWMRFDNAAAPLTLRPVAWRASRDALAARLTAEGVVTRRTTHAADGLVVLEGQPLRTAAWEEGLFVAQDEASQLVAQLVSDLAPRALLDACASPGGKTTYARGRMAPGTRVVACDLRPNRVALLRSTLERTGAPGISVVRADFTRPAPFAPVFDVVLLDAPCSGLGTIRREPEIRWRRAAADLRAFAELQGRLLLNAARCLRPGGRLVYATCSSEPEENEDVVNHFLARHQNFGRLDARSHPWRGTPLEVLLDRTGDLRTLPFRDGLEAFFASILVRA